MEDQEIVKAKKKQSCSAERRVQGILDPLTHKKFMQRIETTGESQSEVIAMIAKHYFAKIELKRKS